jgi:hypothetical protein
MFRATGITAYLEAGSTLENPQAMAAQVRARPSFMIAPATRSPSTKLSGSPFSRSLPFLGPPKVGIISKKARAKHFGEARPGSATIIVKALAVSEWLIEIEAVAAAKAWFGIKVERGPQDSLTSGLGRH